MKSVKNISRNLILALVLTLIADQVSKYFIKTSNIGYVKNHGAGFGILQNMTVFLIIVSIAVFVLIIIYYKKIPKKASYQTFTGLILGGLLGNLFDRIFLGYVIDFIDVGFWPSFNIADAALSAGVIGIIIWMLKEK